MRAFAPLVPALLALAGCTAEITPTVASSTHALDCAADQVRPDGTPCPDDGVCPEPQEGWEADCDARAAACANEGGDGLDPEACRDWLDACFPEGGDGGGGGGADCGGLAIDCWNGGAPDRAACGEWLAACAPAACDLIEQGCAQGLDDACWIDAEVCDGLGDGVDPAELREHACGLLDEACHRGLAEACQLADTIGCAGGGGDDGGGEDGGGGGACGDLLQECTSAWDRDVCFDWLETCAPAEWRGEGDGCADSLHACGDGDLASCQDWLQTCAPASVREPGCIEVLTACYQGDDASCAEIMGECL